MIQALPIDCAIIQSPSVEHTVLFLEFPYPLYFLQLLAKLVERFVAVFADALGRVVLDVAAVPLFMLDDIVLFAAAHKSRVNVDRVVFLVQEALLVGVDQIGLSILHVLLKRILPHLEVAVKVEFHFLLVRCPLLFGQVFQLFGRVGDHEIGLAQLPNIRPIFIECIAYLSYFEHSARLPVGELAVYHRVWTL